MQRKCSLISIITPFYNESQGVGLFAQKILLELNKLNYDWEIICVDDGSTDDTYEHLLLLHEKDPRFKLLKLSRNFGKDVALAAGFRHCKGCLALAMDADLQDPPELIGEMIERWSEGYDVICAKRVDRSSDSYLKRITSKWFYKLFNFLSEIKIPENVGDFQLLDRRVVESMNLFPERRRFMKGLFAYLGYKRAFVEFERTERSVGVTKWNYWKLWNFALDGITSFSSFPLRIWAYFGAGLAFLSFVYAGFLIFRTLFLGIEVPGYASLMVVTLIIGGLNFSVLGMLGEYIGRIYEESKARPLFILDEIKGFDEGSSRSVSSSCNTFSENE